MSFNLDFFYEDVEHTIQKQRPNDFKFHEAVEAAGQDINTFAEQAEKHYTTKMWQWFGVYKEWQRGNKEAPMFDQPTLEEVTDQLKSHFRSIFKANRQKEVNDIKVTVDGMVFDGDEISRARMVTAVVSATSETETIEWSLADNTVATVTASQLKQALRLSGEAMSSIWFQT